MKRLLSFVLAAAVAVPGLFAEELLVDEIVTKANLAAYYAGKDGRSEVSMEITDRLGRTRKREGLPGGCG